MLADQFPQREAEQLMRILLEDLFDIDLKRQLMEPKLRIDEFQYAQLNHAVEALLEGKPVQYVTGKAWFDGLLLHLDESVLIPRPETELLCLWASEFIAAKPDGRLLDLCCGSGCIGLTLKKRFPSLSLTCSDLSPSALSLARENAERLSCEAEFICSG